MSEKGKPITVHLAEEIFSRDSEGVWELVAGAHLLPTHDARLVAALNEIARLRDTATLWADLVFDIGLEVGCLASSFPDCNDHILRRVRHE